MNTKLGHTALYNTDAKAKSTHRCEGSHVIAPHRSLSSLPYIRDGMGWDGMGWDGMGWDEIGEGREVSSRRGHMYTCG